MRHEELDRAGEIPHYEIDNRLGGSSTSKVKFTYRGGVAVRLINKTGAPSVEGTLVAVNPALADSFITAAGQYACGVVYESGIADGQPCWVVVAGMARVLLKDGVASTRSDVVIASATAGRAESMTAPSIGGVNECGYFIQSVGAGTNALARALVSFG